MWIIFLDPFLGIQLDQILKLVYKTVVLSKVHSGIGAYMEDTVMQQNRSLLICVVFITIITLSACSNPRNTYLPKDVSKMEAIKPAVEKLKLEEREASPATSCGILLGQHLVPPLE